MPELMDLEARIKGLEAIEAIEKVRAKYWRCFDKKLWDEMLECFSENATADFGPKGFFRGKDAIVGFLRTGSRASSKSVIGISQGHNPEIDIKNDNEATGIWQIFGYSIDTETNKGRRMAGFYHDEYFKEKGKWKMKSTDANYTLMEDSDREGMSLAGQ